MIVRMKKERIKGRVEEERNKRKKKIKLVLTIIIFLVLIIIIFLILYFKNQKELLKNIRNNYSENIIIRNDTKLYNKNKEVIGSVSKGYKFNLEKVKIKSSNKQYFKIKDTSYYLYFKDIKPSKKKQKEKLNSNYISFNKNVKTSKKTKLYYNEKLAMTINEGVDLPIQYMDEDYYYVLYLNYIFQIKINGSKIIDKANTNIKEAEYISILHYDTIYSDESCDAINCIPKEKVDEHIKYLNEQGYYSISIDEYKNYLDKRVRLKEKAILLTTSTNNDTLAKLNEESTYKIEVVNDDTELKFNNTNKKSTKDSDKQGIDRYVLKNTTSDDNFHKMVKGEEVDDPAVFKKTPNEQSIAVINYHFFYDPSSGEVCNESICLDVKKFREQLDYLKNNGYKTLKMEEFKKWMYGEMELPEKSVLLTIDDGALGTGKHNGNKLIPILEEYDMNATLFLISGWWNVENYRSKNLDIQSHTFDMHQYGDCGRGQVICSTHEQLLEDLKKSLTIVDNNNSFCFPFYSYNDASIQTVKEAGFKLAFIGGSRKAKRSDDRFMIPRYPIHDNTSLSQFINMVS